MKRLSEVQSICPVCNKPVRAWYTDRDGKVFLEKECVEHGSFKALVSNDKSDYLEWIKSPVVNIPPKMAMKEGSVDQCPLNCGVCDKHMQTACCVLIDITERCNQHCPYCFARADENDMGTKEPSLVELDRKLDLLRELGEEERPFNIQLSGGEPTVRDDLPEIIKMVREKGFDFVQINTNGRRLAMEDGYAQILKEAGATVIFMQFDGTRDDIYMITRGEPLLEIKKRAIKNCEKAGLAVTLVPTVIDGVNLDNIGEMMDFMIENVNVVKGIHFQPVSFFGRHPEEDNENGDFEGRVTMFDVLHELEEQRPQFKYSDYCPISTGHTLCCFYSTYIKEPDGSVRCTLTPAKKAAGVACCDVSSMSHRDKMDIVKKDRDYVLEKWEVAPPEEVENIENKYTSSMDIMSMDEFLTYYRRNTFTVTGMAFQDATNLDAERVKRCRVQVLSEDDRLIPFCAYNSIYRGEI